MTEYKTVGENAGILKTTIVQKAGWFGGKHSFCFSLHSLSEYMKQMKVRLTTCKIQSQLGRTGIKDKQRISVWYHTN